MTHFKDVYRHMEWADSMIWRAVLEEEALLTDGFVLRSLFHLHEFQYSFLNSWTGKQMERYTEDSFEEPGAMRDWGRLVYPDLKVFTNRLAQEDLEQPHILPWTKFVSRRLGREATDTTIIETLHQLSSHSMHHRGQVMRRFRELEIAPPSLDYIIWVWSDRPVPVWDDR